MVNALDLLSELCRYRQFIEKEKEGYSQILCVTETEKMKKRRFTKVCEIFSRPWETSVQYLGDERPEKQYCLFFFFVYLHCIVQFDLLFSFLFATWQICHCRIWPWSNAILHMSRIECKWEKPFILRVISIRFGPCEVGRLTQDLVLFKETSSWFEWLMLYWLKPCRDSQFMDLCKPEKTTAVVSSSLFVCIALCNLMCCFRFCLLPKSSPLAEALEISGVLHWTPGKKPQLAANLNKCAIAGLLLWLLLFILLLFIFICQFMHFQGNPFSIYPLGFFGAASKLSNPTAREQSSLFTDYEHLCP